MAPPARGSQGGARRVSGFSPWQLFVLFLVCTLLISIPIWTHPLPPISDYINHLARMHVIATIAQKSDAREFLRDRLEDHPEPDDGPHRSAAGAL